MGRIPEDELTRLKHEVSIASLARRAGSSSSGTARISSACALSTTTAAEPGHHAASNLWHCLGACNAGGSVIDWVMRAEAASFRHAVELLREGYPSLAAPSGARASGVRAQAAVAGAADAGRRRDPRAGRATTTTRR